MAQNTNLTLTMPQDAQAHVAHTLRCCGAQPQDVIPTGLVHAPPTVLVHDPYIAHTLRCCPGARPQDVLPAAHT